MSHSFKPNVLSSLLGCVVVVGGILFFAPSQADAATYYFSPGSGSYTVGSTVSAQIVIDSAGQAINSGEATIVFSSDKLQFQSISKSGSIFTLWTSGPTGSTSSITFGGGLSSPGYTGSGGRVITITWKAIAAGTASVSVSGGKILANDGAGTNVYTGSKTAVYTIGAKTTTTTAKTVSISSFTHSNDEWSAVKKAIFTWSASVNVTGYYIALDHDPATSPTGDLVTDTTATYDNIADGIWYFHVRAASPTGIPVAHFALKIDTVAPDEFTVTIDNENKITNPRPKVIFDTKDSGSGIARYEASIDGGAAFELKSGDRLPPQRRGSHTLVIIAYDLAGNRRQSQATFTIQGIGAPLITYWTPHVNVQRPVRFEGQSSPNDTIVVYLRGKEVDRFIANERKIEDKGQIIAWSYSYTDGLFPGVYAFQFQRIDESGSESELTADYGVNVHDAAFIFGNTAVPYDVVVLGMWTIMGILVLWLILIFRWRQKDDEEDQPNS